MEPTDTATNNITQTLRNPNTGELLQNEQQLESTAGAQLSTEEQTAQS